MRRLRRRPCRSPGTTGAYINIISQAKNIWQFHFFPILRARVVFIWMGVDANIAAKDLFNKSKKQRGRPAGKKDDVKAYFVHCFLKIRLSLDKRHKNEYNY
jgi:hypothetical protein